MDTPGIEQAARPQISRHVGFLLAQLGRAITRHYRTQLAPIGLTPRETSALLQLRAEGPVSQQALGCTLDVDASNLVALLNDLEAENLISRRRDPDDRRRHLVDISDRGTALVDQVEEAAAGAEDQFFAALTAEERGLLRDLLERVSESAETATVDKLPGDEETCT